MFATLVESDPKAPLSIATTTRCREGWYSIPWIAPLYPWSLLYKQGGIKYNFLSFWYDPTWDWNPVLRTIDEGCSLYFKIFLHNQFKSLKRRTYIDIRMSGRTGKFIWIPTAQNAWYSLQSFVNKEHFLGLVHFTLDTYLLMLNVKQGCIKYHFESLVWLGLELNCGHPDDWRTLYIYIYISYHSI